MPDTFCEPCRKEFYYDVEMGLNVVYHEAEVTPTYFRGSGDFPCCPLCERQCDFEKESLTVEIKYSRYFAVKKKI